MNRKLCLFIAMSLDGFIARPDGDISFLDEMNQEGEDYGYSTFIETVDTVILGRKTYDKIESMGLELPYGEREVIVLTRAPKPATKGVSFYSGNLDDLVSSLQSKPGKNIYCDGGGETIQQLLKTQRIDEITVSIVPVLLGEGIRLFGGLIQEQKLKLNTSRSFTKGLTQLHYDII